MSLQQGPADLLITSVAHANQTLLALKTECLGQEQHHRQVIGDFLTHLKLDDIRQIPKRYSEKELDLLLVESAICYSLTVNSSFTIIVHGGIESLEKHFTEGNLIQLNQLLSHSSRSLMLLAKTKLQLEKNLMDFVRDHRKIVKPALEDVEALPSEPAPPDHALQQEMQDKTVLEQTIQTLETDIKTLSEPERLIIEYYETVLKANAIFNKLTEFEKALSSLQTELSKLTPIEETPSPLSKNWESSFGNTEVFDGNDLAKVLQQRLSLKADAEPDHLADWDSLSLPGSKRSSLAQPANPSAMSAALLHQFQQQAAVSAEVLPNANVQSAATLRPDS